jgi:hypothetical protein
MIIPSIILAAIFQCQAANDDEGLIDLNSVWTRSKLSQSLVSTDGSSVDDKTMYSSNRSRDDMVTSHDRSRDDGQRQWIVLNEGSVNINSRQHPHAWHQQQQQQVITMTYTTDEKGEIELSRDHMLANERRQLNTSELSAGKSSRRQSIRRRARRGAIVRFEVPPFEKFVPPIKYMINDSFSGRTLASMHQTTQSLGRSYVLVVTLHQGLTNVLLLS